MALFNPAEAAFARAVSNLVYCNPFLPERIAFERQGLGRDFSEEDPVWNLQPDTPELHPNVRKLKERNEVLLEELRDRLVAGRRASGYELELYDDMVLFFLFHHHRESFQAAINQAMERPGSLQKVNFYLEFERQAEHYLLLPGVQMPRPFDPAHLFACCFQVRRAFYHIFSHLIGASAPAVRLRAAAWQSIFTHDMRRYRRGLFDRMGDFTCLIMGPSGTGKELVARAIGLSRYIPFDPGKRAFMQDFAGSFHPLNLSALSPTLIESELFGHCRGAFTGALQDRAGWLEVCPPLGTVFLDEIGELDSTIQVKLLRVLQTRTFQRLGDTGSRLFRGKIIAATNRNLADEMRAGRFREDFYYRLCADVITTPSLQEQLADDPDELRNLVFFIVRRVAGEAEAPGLTREVLDYIAEHLGRNYPWPGNVRELEQCIRNVVIRKSYQPARPAAPPALDALTEAFRTGGFTADQLIARYCTLVYARTGSFQETARRVGLDRRTVKARIDAELLEALRRGH